MEQSKPIKMTNEEILQEILLDAHALGLMDEVRETATQIMQENPNIEKVVAYQMAFDEWVK